MVFTDAEAVQSQMQEIQGLASMAKVQAMSTGIPLTKLPEVTNAEVTDVVRDVAPSAPQKDKLELKKESDGSVDVDALMKSIGGVLTGGAGLDKKIKTKAADPVSDSELENVLGTIKASYGGK